MKKLEMNQMEVLHGAGPTGNQVACFGFSVAYSLICPIAGFVAGAVCLWA